MTLRHQLDILNIYDPDRSTSTVNVWVAHPTPTEEQALGTLFVVSAIDSNERSNHEVVSLLQDELKRHYYQTTNQNIEINLESALQQTNHRLHQLILEGVGEWVDVAHIVIGVLWRDQLLLSALGTMHAFLVRAERIHDILGQPTAAKPNPLRLFDQLVSGQLKAHDRLMVCTPSMLDYFSIEKIRRTLLDFPPNQVTRTLETTLLGVEGRIAFAGLAIELSTQESPTVIPVGMEPSTPQMRYSPQLSMDQLRSREEATAKILAPSAWPLVKNFFRDAGTRTNQVLRTLLRRPPKRVVHRTTVEQPISPPTFGLRSKLSSAGRSLTATVRSVTDRVPRKSSQPIAIASPRLNQRPAAFGIKPWLNAGVLWFQKLSASRRLSVLGIGLAILLLTTGIVRSGTLQPIGSSNDYADTIASIEDRLTQAEAALLFGGDDIARTQLDEAATLLEELPDRSKKDQERRDPFEDKITELENQLSRLTVITDPEIVARLAGTFPDVRPQQLYLTTANFVVYDPSRQMAILVPRDQPEDSVAVQNTLDIGQPTTGVSLNNQIIFATDRDGFAVLNPSSRTWEPLNGQFPVDNPFVQYLAPYQNRVYALDQTHNQIYRFNRSTSSLGSGVGWLVESADLSQARSAVVDGSIYVLQPGAKVEEYFSGRRTAFELESISPALTDVTRLWTDTDSQYLYLLEPSSNRIVLFSKDGELVGQYQSAAWANLRDVVAVESQKKVFILSGSTLSQFTLP